MLKLPAANEKVFNHSINGYSSFQCTALTVCMLGNNYLSSDLFFSKLIFNLIFSPKLIFNLIFSPKLIFN